MRAPVEPIDTRPYVPRAITDNAGYLLARLGSTSEAAFREALEPLGLRPRHYAVLSALADQGELATQHAVGGCLAIDPSTMVAVVDELEDQGLVTRRRDPSDRRRYLLALTAKGRRIHAACRSAADRGEAEILRALDGDERSTLRRLLKKALVGDDQDVENRRRGHGHHTTAPAVSRLTRRQEVRRRTHGDDGPIDDSADAAEGDGS